MKRKLLATLTALITVFFCAFGLSACGGTNPPSAEPTAFEKAYENYYKTQNMKVVVKDNRITKHGRDYSATVEVDYANKAAHTKGTIWENYYEISGEGEGRSLITYGYTLTYDEVNGREEYIWEKYVRNDIFTTEFTNLFNDETECNVHLLTNWVEDLLPTHVLQDAAYSATADDETYWASLEFLADRFTESNGVWTANICLRITDSETIYAPYDCTVTINLDGQGRFENVVLDLGENGAISAVFTYGTANVVIPDHVKNC